MVFSNNEWHIIAEFMWCLVVFMYFNGLVFSRSSFLTPFNEEGCGIWLKDLKKQVKITSAIFFKNKLQNK